MARNKKGMSGIIAVVILIALVMAAAIIVWVVIRDMIEGKLEGAGSCVDVFEKLKLNAAYTCFEGGIINDVLFSVTRADIDMNGLVVLISGGGITKSFTFDSDGVDDTTNIVPYISGGSLKMPDKNSGLTYRYVGAAFTTTPDSIEIAAIIGDKQCDAADSITDIPTCTSLGITLP